MLGGCRHSGEHLLLRNELHSLAAASNFDGYHCISNCQRVVKEHVGEAAVFLVPTTTKPLVYSCRSLHYLRTFLPQGIHQGLGALGIPVELHGRTVQIAMVKEELKPPQRSLAASGKKGHKMRRAKEPVPVDRMKDLKVARCEHDGANRGALEARPAGLIAGH
jgi:hypothetical protein